MNINNLKLLYLKKQYSVHEIARNSGCSEGKINYWLKKSGIQKRSISEALYRRHNPTGDPFNISSVKDISSAILLGLGLGLYWGEGNKRNPNTIRLGNTDILLIKKFILFLTQILGVPVSKFRFGLQIFSDIEPGRALRYWLEGLKSYGITRVQFQKPVVTPMRAEGTYREKSKWGVLTVYCSNIKLKKILDEMLAKQAI